MGQGDVSEQPENTAAAAPPEALVRGRFALYLTKDDGFVCAVRLEGEDDDRHFHIPGKMIKLAGMMGGNPLAALRAKLAGG